MSEDNEDFWADTVEARNKRQHCGFLHPYTCGNDSNHVLVATEDGWECPECDYRQPYRPMDTVTDRIDAAGLYNADYTGE